VETTTVTPTTDIQTRVKNFLARVIPDHELGDKEDIFAAGYVNSLFAMQLVLFVEKEFHIAVQEADMDTENFRTVDAITQLVERKQLILQGSMDRRIARDIG
jgi:methoxymalonate biosynthesis acyl carrier protein